MEILFGIVDMAEPNKVIASYAQNKDAVADWKKGQFIRIFVKDRNNTRFLDKRIETVHYGRTFIHYGTGIDGDLVEF